ncbi:Membrane associated serine protease, rhomboid family [Nocardia amikacinitolerans]|uniref:rhomboid family intramembrane serine protease n=1 Tax=Nocardia amikacinitolerans TaxID=756689 RepID=UPI000A075520|nr:rhomboid family intramembrane serine protease [Nocardia amikacinitolerans]MCP2320782.1 Membrane associated serine protease, rhomboid family [Nocardia amikacinitolerans]
MTGGLGPSFDPDRIAAFRARLGNPGTVTPGAAPTRPQPARRAGDFAALRQLWLRAGVLIAGFVLLLYAIEGFDAVDSRELDRAGIEPREADGLWGVLWAPVLHGGWDHLMGNTVPVLVLGFLVLAAGISRGLAATAVIWVVAGLGTWLTGADGTVHIGASSLVFGWLTFLILRGWFTRSVGQIVLGLVVLVLYGSLLWGVLPGQDGISWQGHLFGAIGGVVAAWLLAPRQRRAVSPSVA